MKNKIVAKELVHPKKKEPSARQGEIKLKGSVLLATKSDISEVETGNSVCYALVCTTALF